jgi:hypothetical protein
MRLALINPCCSNSANHLGEKGSSLALRNSLLTTGCKPLKGVTLGDGRQSGLTLAYSGFQLSASSPISCRAMKPPSARFRQERNLGSMGISIIALRTCTSLPASGSSVRHAPSPRARPNGSLYLWSYRPTFPSAPTPVSRAGLLLGANKKIPGLAGDLDSSVGRLRERRGELSLLRSYGCISVNKLTMPTERSLPMTEANRGGVLCLLPNVPGKERIDRLQERHMLAEKQGGHIMRRFMTIVSVTWGVVLGGIRPSLATVYLFSPIDVPGAFHTEPHGINEAGQIVGWYADQNEGFVLSGGTFSQRTPREAGGLLGWAVSKTASCA